MVNRISANRPKLLAALLASRDFELEHLEIRADLVEFVTFALLTELLGPPLAVGESREPFLLMLSAMSDKYDHPKALRDVVKLARESIPF